MERSQELDGSDHSAMLELVAQAQRGDTEAVERLVRLCYDRVRKLAGRKIGAALRTRVEPADILQEVAHQAFVWVAETCAG